MYNKINGVNYELIENSSSSENLVFVHGSGCNRKFLRPLAQMLPEFNCYLIDLPNHGDSDNKNCIGAEDYIDAVSEFVSTLNNVTIIGHSLGGTICIGVAARNIPSVKRSIIVSSSAKYYKLDQKIHNMVEKGKADWDYLLECLSSLDNPDVSQIILTLESEDVLIRDFDIDIKVDLEDISGNISIPTLIVAGGDDILALPEYSTKLHEKIDNSKLIIVPNIRHMLPVAKKIYVAQLIREFISQNSI
ncbi:MAG: alpha/beta hydrolase [Clostridium sp.]|jgi:pimeloyl-ACP methyl ester carboxylesterase|uniref:alpha/beta fold hydrolase n=1 Tax=Clostridium sp. TaxID=1506 RepID=UPI0025C1F16C|nr:alpha/beta hydrolase [Clostridium sp.]MCH3963610.1 alpha/beta hydrolase [Clostridium sp.]MCI1714751.1 alpha/beta hydrolase [Clostridium sp.]MCI1799060.1 alpha/beta hydrolase [Clostridium sp.]MCI1812934.1 alpha/beta hydrolase [Clostridium sp.]MCI1869824.1 alpha/beta hydrolase [Clostridium sp.]